MKNTRAIEKPDLSHRNGAVSRDVGKSVVEDWIEPPSKYAFYGLAGRVVDLIEPFSEADRVAVAIQFLTGFGIAAGPRPHYTLGATIHSPRLFVAIVGPTAKARKGSGWDPVEHLLVNADDSLSRRIAEGIGSGEALIYLVRDGTSRFDRKTNKIVVDDPGVKDKRLLIQESELTRLLVAGNREGSIISHILRLAYDGKALRNIVKGSPAEAQTSHIGLVGHSTAGDLRKELKAEQIRNGLGNRFMFFMSRRSRRIPDPQPFKGRDVERMVDEITHVMATAQKTGEIKRAPKAKAMWDDWYTSLRDDMPGIVGAITARAEANVLRLSLIYALTDGSATVEVKHLQAALAMWDYAERSAVQIFGFVTGDRLADRIYDELESRDLADREIYRLFTGNLTAAQLERAVGVLEEYGLATSRKEKPKVGRPKRVWSKVR